VLVHEEIEGSCNGTECQPNAGIHKALEGLTMQELGLSVLFTTSMWIIIIMRFLMSMINDSTKQEKPKYRC
jgi:hypothetical protein